MADFSPSWIVDFLLAHFADSLAEAIGDSELDIEAVIIDSDLIDIVGLALDQRRALESISIRDILISTIPNQVAFEEERFEAWANDAFQFYSNNRNHPEFVRLFSSELNYAVILQDLLLFDTSTKEFRRRLGEMTNYDFDPYVKDNFAASVDGAVYDLCNRAIPEALGRLGADLNSASRKLRPRSAKQITALREIRRDPSFADQRGLVSFRRVAGKLEIGGASTSRSIEYRRQLDRAVTRIRSSSIISRIHNRDTELASLFSEYDEELSSGNLDRSAVSLWIIGQDIDNRVRAGQSATDESEKFDDNTLHYLMTF